MKGIFSNPKPISLLLTLIKGTTFFENNTNDIILDFFAGSGTTGDAVIRLNAEDGGNRKYICVQLPEQIDSKEEAYNAGFRKISDITIERIKRAIKNITKEKQEQNEDIPKGIGFKVFKLTKSNFPRVDFVANPELSESENIENLKQYIEDKESQITTAINRDNIITEIAIKNGVTLNYTISKCDNILENEVLRISDKDKTIYVSVDEDIKEDTISYFKDNTAHKFICLERALDSTKKWNLQHYLGDNFKSY